jgi:hypothetical protein
MIVPGTLAQIRGQTYMWSSYTMVRDTYTGLYAQMVGRAGTISNMLVMVIATPVDQNSRPVVPVAVLTSSMRIGYTWNVDLEVVDCETGQRVVLR